MTELAALDDNFRPYAALVAESEGRPTDLCEFATALAARLGQLASDAIIISMGKAAHWRWLRVKRGARLRWTYPSA
ncbi:MAG: hypothetical protein R2911_43660 [Caldilineaceae bacterium]